MKMGRHVPVAGVLNVCSFHLKSFFVLSTSLVVGVVGQSREIFLHLELLAEPLIISYIAIIKEPAENSIL